MSSSSRALLVSTGLTALLAIGCGADAELGTEYAGLEESVPCEPSLDGGTVDTDGGEVEPEEDAGSEVDAGTDESDAGTDEPDASTPIDPNAPQIRAVTANGTGCASGSFGAVPTSDGQSFELRFDEYEASLSGKQTLAVKDCLVSVDVHVPAGQQFALKSLAYDGEVKLAANATGFHSARWYFQGAPVAAAGERRSDLSGPLDRALETVHEVDDEDLAWSPCNKQRLLQIPTRIQVRGQSDSVVRIDRLHDLKLAYRACK